MNKIDINIMFSGPGNTGKSTALNEMKNKLEKKGFSVDLYEEIARQKIDIVKKKGMKEFQEEIFEKEKKRILKLKELKEKSIKKIKNKIYKIRIELKKELKKILTYNLLKTIGKKNIKINLIDRNILDSITYYNFNLLYNHLTPSLKLQNEITYLDNSIVGKLYDFSILFYEPIKTTNTKEFQMYNDEKILKLFELEFDKIYEINLNNYYENPSNYIKFTKKNIDKINGVIKLKNNKIFQEENYIEKIISNIEEKSIVDYLAKNNF